MIKSSPMADRYRSAKQDVLDAVRALSREFGKGQAVDMFSRDGDRNERRRFQRHFGNGMEITDDAVMSPKDLDWLETSLEKQVARKDRTLRTRGASTRERLCGTYDKFRSTTTRLRELISEGAPIEASSYPGQDAYRRIRRALIEKRIEPSDLADQVFLETSLQTILRQKDGHLKPGPSLTTLDHIYRHIHVLSGRDREDLDRSLAFLARRGVGLSASSRDAVTLCRWLHRLDGFSASLDAVVLLNVVLGHAYALQHGLGHFCSAPGGILRLLAQIAGPAMTGMPDTLRISSRHALIFHAATISVERGYGLHSTPTELHGTRLARRPICVLFREAIADSEENDNADGMCWMTARLVRESLPVGIPGDGGMVDLVEAVSRRIPSDADNEWDSTRLHFEAARIVVGVPGRGRPADGRGNECVRGLRALGHQHEADWLQRRTRAHA